jgi:hypothetical protein
MNRCWSAGLLVFVPIVIVFAVQGFEYVGEIVEFEASGEGDSAFLAPEDVIVL